MRDGSETAERLCGSGGTPLCAQRARGCRAPLRAQPCGHCERRGLRCAPRPLPDPALLRGRCRIGAPGGPSFPRSRVYGCAAQRSVHTRTRAAGHHGSWSSPRALEAEAASGARTTFPSVHRGQRSSQWARGMGGGRGIKAPPHAACFSLTWGARSGAVRLRRRSGTRAVRAGGSLLSVRARGAAVARGSPVGAGWLRAPPCAIVRGGKRAWGGAPGRAAFVCAVLRAHPARSSADTNRGGRVL